MQLKTEVWHQEKPPQGSFTTLEQVVGRVAATSILPGDLITENKLAPKGTVPGITALLSPNQRAMTVKVDEASGVAGFLTPGNRVDVVVVVDKGEYNKDPIAKLLFQNLKVLGTGQKLENRPGDKPQIVPTVTLEVTPEQGERLALAAQEGRISLVLRGQGDQQLVETLGADASKLFGKPRTGNPSGSPRRGHGFSAGPDGGDDPRIRTGAGKLPVATEHNPLRLRIVNRDVHPIQHLL